MEEVAVVIAVMKTAMQDHILEMVRGFSIALDTTRNDKFSYRSRKTFALEPRSPGEFFCAVRTPDITGKLEDQRILQSLGEI
jgi:hypothetical protein